MPFQEIAFQLPAYHSFVNTIDILAIQISVSELHGIICGYLCAGAVDQGEVYIRSLLTDNKSSVKKDANLALFNLYTVSQHQISTFDLGFQLFLPDIEESLTVRAEAFSQWCSGFMEGLTMAGVNITEIPGKDAKDAIIHITQFADLDYEALSVGEEDEKALMEVNEYTRMAVLQIHNAIQPKKFGDNSKTAH